MADNKKTNWYFKRQNGNKISCSSQELADIYISKGYEEINRKEYFGNEG